jgi:hypothetical protein
MLMTLPLSFFLFSSPPKKSFPSTGFHQEKLKKQRLLQINYYSTCSFFEICSILFIHFFFPPPPTTRFLPKVVFFSFQGKRGFFTNFYFLLKLLLGNEVEHEGNQIEKKMPFAHDIFCLFSFADSFI